MKLLEGTVESSSSAPLEPDLIKNPNLHLKLNIDKSKAYVKFILGDMDAKEALKFLHDQVMTKNLLINDQVISHLEMLADPNLGMGQRLAIIQSIQALTASATQITQNKIALDKALGGNLLPHIPETAMNPNPQAAREVPADEFVAAYNKAKQ